MFIKTFTSGPLETNCYLVGCPQTRKVVLIDAPEGVSSSILQFVHHEQLTVQMILITHSHWDHIADAGYLKEIFHIPLYIHALDKPNLISPGSDGLPLYFAIKGAKADGYLKEGEKLQVGNVVIEVIETPGHSPGGLCFWVDKEKVLFSGDTLFKGSIGNLSFPTANSLSMWESLNKLAQFPAESKVYPGHGTPTTIGAEAWIIDAKSLFGERK